MRAWFLLGEYDSETTAYTTLVGPAGSSPFTPPVTGKLVGIRTEMNRSAASSLINAGQFRLTCSLWPCQVEVGYQGGGLQTAPAFQPAPREWSVDLPVAATNTIKIEGKNNTADTPVGVSVMVWGCIEWGG